MALSGKRVGLIVALTALALAGLIVLQVSLLSSAMKIKEQSFKNNAMSALVQISHALAVADATAMLGAASDENKEGRRARFVAVITGDGASDFEEVNWNGDVRTGGSSDSAIALKSASQVQVSVVEDIRRPIDFVSDQPMVDSESYKVMIDADRTENTYIYSFRSGLDSGTSAHGTMHRDTLITTTTSDSLGAELLSSVVGRMFGVPQVPLEDRLDSINVDSIVAATMRASGIDMEYAFGIFADFPDSLTYARPDGFNEELRESDLRSRLFHQDLMPLRAYMTLHFPERQAYLWAQITPMVSAEVLFMLIIIACFAYTIRTIMKQRKFSALLVDFINNMTHEFKTPISTVALATEAIERPDILAQKDKVLQFNSMIRTEITRMRNQAEKILQMATLEEGDIALAKNSIDLHQIIRDAVDAVSIQIEHRGGTIRSTLDAGTSRLNADSLHIANIVHNLLDNAVKYSSEAPHVLVRTSRNGDEITVEIEDRGLGMTAEHQEQAFQKYFRVPTGNMHNVKGFGLGLAYVKLMVEAHGGAVSLKSQPGVGTTVSIVLPMDLKDEIS